MLRNVSDVDHAEWLNGPDPRECAERQDEEAREQRWAEFIAFVKQARISVLLHYIASCLNDSSEAEFHNGQTRAFRTLVQFAETEGWHGVLSAIARAMREDEQAKRELMDRR